MLFLIISIIFILNKQIMNQKTLQGIYKSFQTEQFYRRYLVELGCREDRRKIDELRSIKVTSKNNSVVVSCGQTIVIAHIETIIQSVTFSPVSNSYGQPLLKIKVSNANNNQKNIKESKSDKAIEHFIQKKIEWGTIQDQLAGSDLVTGKQYAYKGHIIVRVLGDDGGIEEYSLLAVQLLLLTCKFKKFIVNKQKIQLKQEYGIFIKSFIYPLKYCEILQKILIDPSLTEIQNADLVVTILKDIKSENPPTVIQGVKNCRNTSSESSLINIMKRWEVDISKASVTFERKIEELRTNYECVLN